MVWKSFRSDIIACLGEFAGTSMFLFLALGAAKTAQDSQSAAQNDTVTTLAQQTIMFISAGFGLSLLVTAWVFYRITGGLFNPAVTLSLWLIGGLTALRAILLTGAQIAGGIAGAALVAGLTPGGNQGGIGNVITTLQPGMTYPKGVFLEAFLTAMLVFTVLMLAAEKHKATFLAPIGIGLVLFVCQLFGTLWTGCGMNPARSFGPSVITGRFPGYHWIYWVGPLIGSLIATFIYTLLKTFNYSDVVLGQDSDNENASPRVAVASRLYHASFGFSRSQRAAMLASGMRPEELERAEAGMVNAAALQNGSSRMSESTLAPNHPNVNMHPTNGTLFGSGQKAEVDNLLPTHTGSAGLPVGSAVAGADAPPPALPLMTAAAQERGGVGAPGAHGSGLTVIGRVRSAFKH